MEYSVKSGWALRQDVGLRARRSALCGGGPETRPSAQDETTRNDTKRDDEKGRKLVIFSRFSCRKCFQFESEIWKTENLLWQAPHSRQFLHHFQLPSFVFLVFLVTKTKAWFLVKSNALPQRPVTFDITTCNLANRGNEQMRDMNKKWTANEDRLNKLLPRWAFGRSIEICWVLKRSKLQDWTVRKAAGLTHWSHHGPHSPVTQQFEEITVVTTSGREAAKSDEDHDYFGISCPALHVGILRNWIKQIQCRLLQLLQAHLMLAVVRSVAQAVSTFNRFQSVSDS